MDPNLYEPLKKKYALPEFNVLDAEFGISAIEENVRILRNICKKIGEHIEFNTDVLQRVLQPDPNCYADIYECKFFSGAEKDALFVLFKHLMHSYRNLLEIDLINDEKLFADFIKQFVIDWSETKKSLLPFFEKLKNVWKETRRDREKLEYLG